MFIQATAIDKCGSDLRKLGIGDHRLQHVLASSQHLSEPNLSSRLRLSPFALGYSHLFLYLRGVETLTQPWRFYEADNLAA